MNNSQNGYQSINSSTFSTLLSSQRSSAHPTQPHDQAQGNLTKLTGHNPTCQTRPNHTQPPHAGPQPNRPRPQERAHQISPSFRPLTRSDHPATGPDLSVRCPCSLATKRTLCRGSPNTKSSWMLPGPARLMSYDIPSRRRSGNGRSPPLLAQDEGILDEPPIRIELMT